MTNSTKAVIAMLLLMIGVIIGSMVQPNNVTKDKMSNSLDIFKNEYDINIVDEHQVILTCNTDTVILYFENSSVLADEYVVFVSHK